MMSVEILAQFRVRGSSRDALEEACESVMSTLVTLEGCGGNVSDAAVSVDLEERLVEIELIGHGDTFEAARASAESAVHSAIHEVGGRIVKKFDTQALKAELTDA